MKRMTFQEKEWKPHTHNHTEALDFMEQVERFALKNNNTDLLKLNSDAKLELEKECAEKKHSVQQKISDCFSQLLCIENLNPSWYYYYFIAFMLYCLYSTSY